MATTARRFTVEEVSSYDAVSDVDADGSPAEIQLDKLHAHLAEFSAQLRDIEDALDSSVSAAASAEWSARDSLRSDAPIAFDASASLLGVLPNPFDSDGLYLATSNFALDKVLWTFGTLLREAEKLQKLAHEQLFPALGLLDEVLTINDDSQDGAQLLAFARMLGTLQRTWSFRTRCYAVAQNMVQQLQALFHPASPLFKAHFDRVRSNMPAVFGALGFVLALLAQLDGIIDGVELQEPSGAFKRMLRTVRASPERFNSNADEIGKCERALELLEGDLFSDSMRLFGRVLDGGFFQKGSVAFNKAFAGALKQLQAGLLSVPYQPYSLTTASWPTTLYVHDRGIGFCALLVLYSHMCGVDDDAKKSFRALYDGLLMKQPLLPASASLPPRLGVFSSFRFMRTHAPQLVRAVLDKDNDLQLIKAQLSELQVSLDKVLYTTYAEAARLLVRLDRSFSGSVLLSDDICAASDVAQLASSISAFYRLYTGLHDVLDAALTTTAVYALVRLAELQNMLSSALRRNSSRVARRLATYTADSLAAWQLEIIDFANHCYKSKGLDPAFLFPSLARLAKSEKSYFAVEGILLIQCLDARAFSKDYTLAKTSPMQVYRNLNVVVEKDTAATLERLARVIGTLPLMDAHIDISSRLFAFYHNARDFSQIYFSYLRDRPQLSSRIPYFFSALVHCHQVWKAAEPALGTKIDNSFAADVMKEFEDNLVMELAKRIENDLRLHTHAVVLGQTNAQVQTPVRDWSRFLTLPPFSTFDGSLYDMKAEVVSYLTQTFYRLTALCPHDWATYEEMRVLAHTKYALDIPSFNLPGATVDQGLDILELTRNIHVFVQSYAYNMNTQSFLQRPHKTPNKYLHSVQIAHVANSVRTHGAGIMNTAVNFVYRFLARRFFALSQFLYDDHIKSHLAKEQKQWTSVKNESFSFARADKLLRSLRKLGPYLDKFRELVTEIGNAIAYVRMVRSAGLHAISQPMEFLRSKNRNSAATIESSQMSSLLHNHTSAALGMLDRCIDELATKFSGGSTDYFGLLTSVFHTELAKDEHVHCKLFAMICPALMLAHSEYMVSAKDRLMKTATASKYQQQQAEGFSEDGFALGIAFTLRVLDLDQAFDSLHWFDAVADYSRALEEQGPSVDTHGLSSQDEVQTQRLAMARIQGTRREFELLRWTFMGARVLFYAREEESALSANVKVGAAKA
jgi:WASH complex subunit 7